MSASPGTPRPRRWYRHPLGIAYLVILGLVALAALIVTIAPMGGAKADKSIVLMVLYGAVDLLMLVPLALWAFRRDAFRFSRYPAVDLLLGLFLFAVGETAVIVYLLFACLGATGG
jgi:hypothetical protein